MVRHLRAVKHEEDLDALVAEAMESWTPGQRACRARRHHNWRASTVFLHSGQGADWYEVTEVCTSCKNHRRREMDDRGYWVTRWGIRYSGGYLLPKGSGGVSEDQSARLRLKDIQARRITMVKDAS